MRSFEIAFRKTFWRRDIYIYILTSIIVYDGSIFKKLKQFFRVESLDSNENVIKLYTCSILKVIKSQDDDYIYGTSVSRYPREADN